MRLTFSIVLSFLVLCTGAQESSHNVLSDAMDSLRPLSGEQFIGHSTYFEEVIERTQNASLTSDSLNLLRANYILNLAYAYETKAENYIRAQELYVLGKEIHEVKLDTAHFSAWAFAIHHLANIYTRFGDWRRAVFMLRLLRDERIALDAEDPYLPGVHLDLSVALHSGGNTSAAVRAVDSLKEGQLHDLNYANLLKARYFLDLGDVRNAKEAAHDARSQFGNLPPGFIRPTLNERLSTYHQIRTEIYVHKGDLNLALTHIDSALLANEIGVGRAAAKILNDKARILIQLGELASAAECLKRAQEVLGAVPTFKSEKAEVFLENSLVENYELIGDWYAQYSHPDSIVKAISWYEKTVEVDFFIWNNLFFDESKSFINSNNKLICEKGLRQCLRLSRISNSLEYVNRAYTFTEFNKAALLRQANKRSPRSTSTEMLVGQLGYLQAQRADLQRRIRLSAVTDSTSLIRWQKELRELTVRIADIEDGLAEHDMTSGRLPYVATVGEIQKKLKQENSHFTHFFMGAENLYRFHISPKEFKLDSFSLNSGLKDDMMAFNQILRRPWSTLNDQEVFDSLSRRLLQVFKLPTFDIKTWHLSCDEVLHSFPIGALWDEDRKQFLFQATPISYHYSPSIWMESLQERHPQKISNFLIVAPTQYTNNELPELAFNSSGIEIPGSKITILNLGEATYENTIQHMTMTDVVHFHTHGSTEPINRLELYDGPIFVDELIPEKISCQLAVLSACESGSGKISASEGPQSMARGFAKAGVPTTVMTLWKVNSASTQSVLSEFYKGLSRGQTSSEALHQAQAQYLETAPPLERNPYYWAGIVHSGIEYENASSSFFSIRILLLILAMTTALALFLRYRRRLNS